MQSKTAENSIRVMHRCKSCTDVEVAGVFLASWLTSAGHASHLSACFLPMCWCSDRALEILKAAAAAAAVAASGDLMAPGGWLLAS